jgi:hypothetical protein
METPKQAEFNLRGKDGELFFLVKERLEKEFGPLSNAQAVRIAFMDVAKRKKINFKF